MLNEGRMAFEDPKQEVRDGDDAWLEKQWAHFNKKFFGGKLKKPKELIWVKSSGSYGRCGYDFDGKKLYTSYIKIAKKHRNYLSFKNTLVHEMCHQYVNETYVTKDDIKRANGYGMARSRKWWNYIDKCKGAGSDGHHGTWLQICEKIMKKAPELSLSKYGSDDETILTTKEVKKVVKAQAGCHVVMQEGDPRTPRRHFYYITDACYKDLLKLIKNGEKQGQWTEYKFDPAKMAQEKLNPMNYIGNSYWSGSYFDNLCERGVIEKWGSTRLGGEKTVHHRRTRRSLWW